MPHILVVALVRSELLDLGQLAVSEYPLDQANKAVAQAAASAGPFRTTVLRP